LRKSRDKLKRKRLETKGWKIGTVKEFMELTPEEAALVEIKLALSRNLKVRRQNLMTTGATPQDIGQIIASVQG
jgi:hypothetical protein